MTSAPPHVLMIVRSFAADGPGRLLCDLWRTVDPEDLKLSVVSLEREGPLRKEFDAAVARLGGNLKCVPTGWRHVRSTGRAVARLAFEWNVDAMHGHLLRADVVGRLAAARCGVPYLTTEHGLHGWSEKSPLLRPAVRKWYLATQRRCSAIVAVSERTRRELLATGVKKRLVRRIDNAIDVSSFQTANDELRAARRREFDMDPGNGPVLLALGSLSKIKAPELAVRILAELRTTEQGAATRLIFVGGGPLEHKVMQLAEELGVRGAVKLTGPMADPRAALEAADLLLHCSHSESFGLAMLEAMASGLPVVARAGAGPEGILPPGPIGHLVEGNDPAIWAHTTSNALRIAHDGGELFRNACRTFVEKTYSIESMKQSYLSLYGEVVKNRQRAATVQ